MIEETGAINQVSTAHPNLPSCAAYPPSQYRTLADHPHVALLEHRDSQTLEGHLRQQTDHHPPRARRSHLRKRSAALRSTTHDLHRQARPMLFVPRTEIHAQTLLKGAVLSDHGKSLQY